MQQAQRKLSSSLRDLDREVKKSESGWKQWREEMRKANYESENFFQGVKKTQRGWAQWREEVRLASKEVEAHTQKIRTVHRDYDTLGTKVHNLSTGLQNMLKTMSQSTENMTIFGRAISYATLASSALVPTIVALGASLVSLASSLALAAAGLGGAFLAGLAAIAPAALLGVAALARLKDVMAAVKAEDKAAATAAQDHTDAIKRQTQASHGLIQANESVAEAQKRLTEARREAKRTLDDLNLSQLEGQRSLQEAIRSGDVLAIARAQQNLRQIREDTAKAQAQGISGSDVVVQAQRALRDAKWSLDQAKEAVAESKKPTGAAEAAAQANKQLSPAEQSLKTAIKSLRDDYKKIAQPLTDEIVGTFTTITNQIHALFKDPAIQAGFAGVAHSVSESLKIFTTTLLSPEAKGILTETLANSARELPKFSKAMADLGLGIGRITNAAAPLFDHLLDSFSNWTAGLGKNRKALDDFFAIAEQHMRAWGALIGSVGDLFGQLFKTSGPAGLRLVKDLTGEIKNLVDYLSSNQAGAQNFFNQMADVTEHVARAVKAIILAVGQNISYGWIKTLADFITNVFAPALGDAIRIINVFSGTIAKILQIPVVKEFAEFAITALLLGKALQAVVLAAKGIEAAFIVLGPIVQKFFALIGTSVKGWGGYLTIIIAILVILQEKWQVLSRVIEGLHAAWDAVLKAIGASIDWIRDHWQTLVAILAGPFGIAIKAIIDHFDSIKSFFSGIINWIRSNWETVLFGILTGPFGLAAKWIVDTFKDVPQDIADFFSNIDWVGVGESIGEGLWNGIKSIPGLGDLLGLAEQGIGAVASWFAAKGGLVPGPAGAGDVIPAMLSPGEVVLTSQMVGDLGGAAVMDVVARRGGRVGGNRFQDGGYPAASSFPNLSPWSSANPMDYFTPAQRAAIEAEWRKRLKAAGFSGTLGPPSPIQGLGERAERAQEQAFLHHMMRSLQLLNINDKNFAPYVGLKDVRIQQAFRYTRQLLATKQITGKEKAQLDDYINDYTTEANAKHSPIKKPVTTTPPVKPVGAGALTPSTVPTSASSFGTTTRTIPAKNETFEAYFRRAVAGADPNDPRVAFLVPYARAYFEQERLKTPARTITVAGGVGTLGGGASGLVPPLSTGFPKHSSFNTPDGPEGVPSKDGYIHGGLDWFAPAGTPVHAPIAGVIVEAKPSRGTSGQVFGGTIKLQAEDGRVFVFRHVVPSVGVDAKVKAGATVATVSKWDSGSTHAHLEVWKSLKGGYTAGNMIDPWVAYQTGQEAAGAVAGLGAGVGGVSASSNRALGRQMAAAYGWTGAEWSALDELWTHESGWRSNAENPGGTGSGIPQRNPKVWPTPADWANPKVQIAWGLTYIKNRYGSPSKAWAFWKSKAGPDLVGGTYASGGELPGNEGVAVPIVAHAGEMILNRRQQAVLGGANFLRKLFGFSKGGGPGSHMQEGGYLATPAGLGSVGPLGGAAQALMRLVGNRKLFNLQQFTGDLTKILTYAEGLIASLEKGFTDLRQKSQAALQQATYRFTKTGQAIKALTDEQILYKSLEELDRAHEYLLGERGVLVANVRAAQAAVAEATRRLNAAKPKDRPAALEALQRAQGGLDTANTALFKNKTDVAQIAQERYQAQQDIINFQINKAMEAGSRAIDIQDQKIRVAQSALGGPDYNAIRTGLLNRTGAIVEQISSLRGLQNMQGITSEQQQQLEDRIRELTTQLAENAKAIRDNTAEQIASDAAKARAPLETKATVAGLDAQIAQSLPGGGVDWPKYLEAMQAETNALQSLHGVIQDELTKTMQYTPENTDRINELTIQLKQNELAVAQNTSALHDAQLKAITAPFEQALAPLQNQLALNQIQYQIASISGPNYTEDFAAMESLLEAQLGILGQILSALLDEGAALQRQLAIDEAIVAAATPQAGGAPTGAPAPGKIPGSEPAGEQPVQVSGGPTAAQLAAVEADRQAIRDNQIAVANAQLQIAQAQKAIHDLQVQEAQKRIQDMVSAAETKKSLASVAVSLAQISGPGFTPNWTAAQNAIQQMASALQSEASTLRSAISQATSAGLDPQYINGLKVQLAQNELAVVQNNQALRDLKIQMVQFQLTQALLPHETAKSISDIDLRIAQISGPNFTENLAAMATALTKTGQELQAERPLIQQALADAIAQALPQENIDALRIQLKQNELSILENNKQLAELNGSETQDFSSTSWQWLRNAIFTGAGGLLPQYMAPVASTTPILSSAVPGYQATVPGAVTTTSPTAPATTTTTAPSSVTVNVTNPTQTADPDYIANRISWHMKGRR